MLLRAALPIVASAMAADRLLNEDDVLRASALIDQGRYEEALRLIEPLAHAGYARAQALLGWMREVGRGCNRDYVAAERWYGASADQGYAPAQFYLGSFFQRRGQRDRGAFFFKRAAEQGFLPAYYRLALDALRRGDRGEALRLFGEAKGKGHLPSALRLSGIVVRGRDSSLLAKLSALIRFSFVAAQFVRISMRKSNDERVLR